jgi:hypothetical protein
LTAPARGGNLGRMATRLLLGLLALLLAPLAAVADQRDPRLDALFITLQKTKDNSEAVSATLAIRRIWAESPIPGVEDALFEALLQTNGGDLEAAIAGYDKVIEAAPDFAEA